MQLFDAWRFSNYWFGPRAPRHADLSHQAAAPREFDVQQFEQLDVEELAFSTYDIDRLAIVPLLFQTGYLTIKGYEPEGRRYELTYPNYEVENAFLTYLLDAFSKFDQGLSTSHLWQLIDALQAHQLDKFFQMLKVFFANIDYDLHLRNEKY